VVCTLGVLAATVSAAGTAWCQGYSREPSEEPPKPDYDDVEQKPVLSEAEYQKAREQRAKEEAAKRHQQGQEEVEPPPSLGPEVNAQFELGVRSGIGMPFGTPTGDTSDDMTSLMTSQVPIWGDLGVRFDGKFFFGLHASYGFAHLSGALNDACDQDRSAGATVDCHGSDTRVGLEFLYHAHASRQVDVWFGTGLGWEWLSIGTDESFQGQSAKATVSANGIQLVMLQFGIDFEPIPTLGVGPFVALSNDMYFNASTNCEGACNGVEYGDSTIQDTSIHHWVLFGVRASWRP
jgi:hypothetical protein